jgi:single-strand DNA-binding protein
MASYNRIILLGNLTRDPQLSYLPNQTPVVEFGLATNRRWKSNDGQQREETCFIDCRAYGRQAEVLGKYMQKGKPLLVEGRLSFDQWEGQDGAKRSKHRVTVENFTFMDARSEGQGAQGGQGGGYNNRAQGGAGYSQQAPTEGGYSGGDDDIPF